MIVLNLFLTVIGFFLAVFLLTALKNGFFYPRLTVSPPHDNPRVSICIPARNEAAVIERTVASWLAQSSRNFELLILDDQSTDNTAAILHDYAQIDGRLHVLSGQPLPAGWLGKNWACHQLSHRATADLLLFTDADVVWQPHGLAALLAHQDTTKADLLSVWPGQQTGSWSEWLVVPLMKFAILAYLPLAAVYHTPWTAFAAANGQALLFERDIYRASGGHEAVKEQIVEDVALARAVKREGGRLRMADGGKLATARMYRNWPEVLNGFAKNILAGHGHSVPFLLLSTVWHWAAFVGPWIAALLWPQPATLIVLALAIALRLVTELLSDRRPFVAFLRALTMPLGVVLMTLVAGRAVRWHFGAGPLWKGRHATV